MMISLDTYIVSLPNRLERRSATIERLRAAQFNLDFVRVVDAQATPRNGAIGCAMSHAFALSLFMFESDAPCCLIVEDDFEVVDGVGLAERLREVLVTPDLWDVILLASNVAIREATTPFKGVFRVSNAQAPGAYLVSRNYAPKLIQSFFESGERMSSMMYTKYLTLQRHFFAIDQTWKSLQFAHRYLAFMPPLSRQLTSSSEFENAMNCSEV